jgi:radical SAM superfamily enzyme YgiQ (UPF0313 family)
MKTVTIYLAQLTHETYGIPQNRIFPLGAGYVGAAIKNAYGESVNVEIFKSPIELNRKIEFMVPDMIMFGAYMWNNNLTYKFAQNFKEKFPESVVIMGGPNFPVDIKERKKLLIDYPYIDALIINAAEVAAINLVGAYLLNKTKESVRSFKDQDVINYAGHDFDESIKNRLDSRLFNGLLDEMPSPYLMGLMDKFFVDGDVPLVETNRGCPFTCAFCQQGENYFSKVINHSVDRVKEELLYITDKIFNTKIAINALELADANFGMYTRDIELCKMIRKLQDEYSYPKIIGCSTGKNKPEIIIDCIEALLPKTIILRSAMQSINPATLTAIRRDNIKLSFFRSIQQKMAEKGLENCADIMLGLPEESTESHLKGILDLINLGINELALLQTIVLRGTTFDSITYREQYGIKTKKRVIPECGGTYLLMGSDDIIIEFEDVVVETNTLTSSGYLEARRIHLIIMLFHNSRLLNFVYQYCDLLDIPRSCIINEIAKLKNSDFEIFTDSFLSETKQELLDASVYNIPDGYSLENKIFKYLSFGFFVKKTMLMNIITKVLFLVLPETNHKDISELVYLTTLSMIDYNDDYAEKNVKLISGKLKKIFGDSILLSLSDYQKEQINFLLDRLKDDPSFLSKFSYRLRPDNMTVKVKYGNR